MRTLRSWGMVVACVTIVGTASAWAGDDEEVKTLKRRPPPSWRRATVWEAMGRVIEPDKKPTGKKGDAKSDAKAKKETASAAKTALPGDEGVDENAGAEAAFLRRSAACLKLQEIAVQTNDPELLKRAEQLSDRAWATYAQRTADQPAGDAAQDEVRGKAQSSGKEAKLSKKEDER